MPSPARRRSSRAVLHSKKPNVWIAAFCLCATIAVGSVMLFRYAFASDGSGTNVVSPPDVTAGSTGNAPAFTFTAAENMSSGEIAVTVPAGWSAPQGTPGTAGYVTAVSGSGVIADVLNRLEDATGWSATQHMALSADTGDKQEGTGSLLNTIGTTAAANEQWYFNYGAASNWGGTATGNLRVGMWLKSSVATALGDYSWQDDDTAGLASPLDTIAVPALPANTWTYTSVTLGATTRTSVSSYGFRYTNDIGAATLRADSLATLFNTADSTTGGKSDANITRSFISTAGDFKEGTSAWRCAYAAGAGIGTSGECYFNNTNDTIGPGTTVSFWIRSSVALNAGDFVWIDDNNADFASPADVVNIPALAANTWTYVTLNAPNSSNLTVKSYGFRQVVDKGALNLDVDAMGKQVDAADLTAGWAVPSANVQTLSSDTATFHEGAASLKNVITSYAAAGDRWYQTLGGSQDWTDYTTVGMWIRSTAATTAGQLKFEYSTTTDLSSPIASVNVGALAANTWTYQTFALSGTRATVQSYGINYAADIGAATVNLDGVLIGPGVPTFPGGGVISARLLSLTTGQTAVITYGSGGGASGAVAPTLSGVSTFTTQSRVSDAGSLQTISSSPTITVNPAATSQFALNDPGDITAGTRAAYTVTRRDSYGNLVTSGTQTVYLYSDSTGNKAFYAVESGGSPVASVTIADGASSAAFWYYDDKAGSFTVTVSDNATAPDGAGGIADATDGIAVSAASVSQFRLSDPGGMVAGTRLGYVVSREDQFGNPVDSGTDTAYLYSNSSNNPEFYAAEVGGSPVASVTIAGPSASATFWYADEAAGTVTVTASDNAVAPDGLAGIDDASDDVVVSGAQTVRFALNDPGNTVVGARLGYVVSRADAFGNAATSGTDTAYLYSDSTGNAFFYDAESGGNQITSIAIENGNSTAAFWYADDRVATVNVTVSDNATAPDGADGIDDATDAVDVTIAPASRFTIVSPSATAVGELMTVIIRAEDAFGNLDSTYQGDVTLVASGSATGAGLVDVVDGIGTTEISDVIVETVQLTLDDTEGTGLDVTATVDATFTTGPTRAFELTDPGDMTAGARIAYVVTRRDSFGNLVTAGSDTAYLFGDATAAFYDAAESGSQITSISIGSGASSATFWYQNETAGTFTVFASDNASVPDGLAGIDDAQDDVIVSPGPVSRFLLNDPGDTVAGSRVGYVVSREDQYGNPATSGDTHVRLYTDSAGPAAFYDAGTDGTVITSLIITDGNADGSFWYADERSGTVSVTVSDDPTAPDGMDGVNDASDALVVSAGLTERYVLDNPGDITVDTSVGYTVTRKDAFGNLVTDGEEYPFLYSDSIGAYAFFDAAVDGNRIDTVTFNDGQSSTAFWYYDDAGGVWTVTASDNAFAPDGPVGIIDGTDLIEVSTIPIVATRVVILNPTDATVGDSVPVTLRAVDDFGSVDTTFAGTVTLERTGSATGAETVSFAAGVGTVEISDTVAETVVLTLNDTAGTGLNMDSSQDIVFAPGPTSVYALNDPGDTTAGTRIGYVLTRTDAYGNLVVDGSETADLLSAAEGSATFYEASSGGSQISSVTIANGSSTAEFWYANEQAASETITVSGTDTVSDDIVVAPGPTAQYVLNDPGDMSTGTRLGYEVSRTDAFGNAVTAGAETVGLFTSSIGAAAFYDASAGGNVTTSVAFGEGESSKAFWYFDDTDGVWLITVSDGSPYPDGDNGVDDGSDTVTVTTIPISATRFTIVDPSNGTVGGSVTVTIRAEDDFGSVDTTFQGRVSLVVSGSATGGGTVTFVNGIGTATVSDAVEEAVTLSLIDSDATGFDVSSVQNVSFDVSGGGGATVSEPEPAPAPVIPTVLRFEGRAYPGALATLLGHTATESISLAQTTAAASGAFALSYEGPFDRLVSYEVVVTDAEGVTAPGISFEPSIPAETTTTLTLIAPPTVHLFQRSVLRGNALSVSGFAEPGSTVELTVDAAEISQTVKTKDDGSYKLFLDTASMAFGLYVLHVRAILTDGQTVDAPNPGNILVSSVLNAGTDLNGDGIVNITDWSVFLVQWGSPDPAVRAPLDFNRDGVVDISDFSVFIRSIRH